MDKLIANKGLLPRGQIDYLTLSAIIVFMLSIFQLLFCPANKDNKRDVAVNEPIDHPSLAAINIDNDFIWFNANPMVAAQYRHPCGLLFTLAAAAEFTQLNSQQRHFWQ